MTAETPPSASRSLSLASRLALTFAVSLVILCAAISFVLDHSVIRSLDANLEHLVETEVRRVKGIVASTRDPAKALGEHLRHLSEAPVPLHVVLRVRSSLGETVISTKEADHLLPPPPDDERPYRLEQTSDAMGREFTIEVLGQTPEIDRFVGQFRIALVFLVTPLMIGAILSAYFIVRRTLAPLEHVTAAAARIGSKTLGERLEVRRAPAEIARLAASFNEMLDRLEDAFRKLQEFGADLAHELRTPLQNVRGEAEVALLKPRTPAEYREILAGMIEECERIGRIVDDVLLLSRVERNEEALNVALFDLAEEVAGIHEYFLDFAVARGLRLASLALHPLEIQGDRLKLRRAIANLVDNALKYTDSGGDVTVEARPAAGGVELIVADTGKGIAPEHIPKLFERFYRVEKSRSREFGGSGLGLGIARTLVRAHGGEVTIESEPGRGTRARIFLPVLVPLASAPKIKVAPS